MKIWEYNYTGTKIDFVVPKSGIYLIECIGAQGQGANGTNTINANNGAGGFGAYAKSKFELQKDTPLVLSVGECPAPIVAHTTDMSSGGGGGMSAVAVKGSTSVTDVPLVVAGGGGGGTEMVCGGSCGGAAKLTLVTQGNSGAGWNSTGSSYQGKSWVDGLARVDGNKYGGGTSFGGYGGGGGGQDDSGGGGGGGYQGGSYGAPSSGGGSYVSSLYNASSSEIVLSTTNGSGLIRITLMYDPNYSLNGEYISIPYTTTCNDLSEIKVSWVEDVPQNTSLDIFLGISSSNSVQPDQYIKISNNSSISSISKHTNLSDKFIWLKMLMSSSDATLTPSVNNINILCTQYDPKGHIALNINPIYTFRNSVNNLRVDYKQNMGALSGVGGAVQDFNIDFVPTNLTPKNNPNDKEKIMVGASASIVYTYINLKNAYSQKEKIVATPSVSVVYTDVTIVNP